MSLASRLGIQINHPPHGDRRPDAARRPAAVDPTPALVRDPVPSAAPREPDPSEPTGAWNAEVPDGPAFGAARLPALTLGAAALLGGLILLRRRRR